MPIEVLHQIQYLCKNIPKVEWSGVLFYTTEGSITQPSKFKIRLKTILPLDMGTAAYTEYTLDARFMDFIEEDFEERCHWKVGHIHSHNVMRVFFSGTDLKELDDNAPAHNFYLSLIVNNYMDFIAKVAFIGEAYRDIPKVKYTALDAEGKPYVIFKEDFEVKSKKLFIYNCAITSPKTEIIVEQSFMDKVKVIMLPKPKPMLFSPVVEKKSTNPFDGIDYETKKKYPLEHLDDFAIQMREQQQLEEETDYDPELDFFLCSLIFPLDSTDHIELELIFEEALSYNTMTAFELASLVLSNYPTLYIRIFSAEPASHFVHFTKIIIEELEIYAPSDPRLLLTIEKLSASLAIFTEDEYRTTTKI